MQEHLGHLCQRPSGISLFFDFGDAIFGFLRNVLGWSPKGASAGESFTSKPRSFFVKLVVAILEEADCSETGSVITVRNHHPAELWKPSIDVRVNHGRFHFQINLIL